MITAFERFSMKICFVSIATFWCFFTYFKKACKKTEKDHDTKWRISREKEGERDLNNLINISFLIREMKIVIS